MTVTRHRGVWTNPDRNAQFYRYLPFEVPAGSAGITVRLEYDTTAGVLDLGAMGPSGFRGWSGGARTEFQIGHSDATPGYRPGAWEPGQWEVMLGLHRVYTEMRYEVTIEVSDSAPRLPAATVPVVPARPPRRELPAPPGMTWLAGDTHCHSVHSDGHWSLEQLAATAVEAGLDFLAISDHNTDSHHQLLPAIQRRYGVTLLPAQEVTTERGHANVFGDIGWIDFRQPARDWWRTAETRGGLLSVNHPIAADCGWRHRTPPAPLAEIWHCTWRDRTQSGPLAWWAAQPSFPVAVGGSDFHAPGRDSPIGQPTTWVCVPTGDDSAEAVLGGLRRGAVAVSAGRQEPLLLPWDDALLVADAEGCVLTDLTGRRRTVRGSRVSMPADEAGPQWLETPRGEVVALCTMTKA